METKTQHIELLNRLISAKLEADVLCIAKKLCSIALQNEAGMMPRGKLNVVAESKVNSQLEQHILFRWAALDGETHDWISTLLSLWGGSLSATAISKRVATILEQTAITCRVRDSLIDCVRAMGILGGRESVTGLAMAIVLGPDDDVVRIADYHLKELALGGSEDASHAPAFVSDTYFEDVFENIQWPRLFQLTSRGLMSWYVGLCRLADILKSRTMEFNARIRTDSVVDRGWPNAIARSMVSGVRPVPANTLTYAIKFSDVAREALKEVTVDALSWNRFSDEMEFDKMRTAANHVEPLYQLWSVAHCHLADKSRVPNCSTLARSFDLPRLKDDVRRAMENASIDNGETIGYMEVARQREKCT